MKSVNQAWEEIRWEVRDDVWRQIRGQSMERVWWHVRWKVREQVWSKSWSQLHRKIEDELNGIS